MRTLSLVLVSLAVGTLVLADVTYQQETKLGGFMKIATMGRSLKSTTRIAGDRMRTDNEERVQIVDVAAEKIYDLDLKKKTYTVMTFEEMRKRMEQAFAEAKAKSKEAQGKEAKDVAASVDVKVTPTENQQVIAGYPCKQFLLQTDLNVKDKEKGQQGTLSTLMDVWMTKDAPGAADMKAFYMKMGQKLGTTELSRQMAEGGQVEFAEGMKRLGTELRKMEGFAMRTVIYMGSAEAARADALAAAKPKPETPPQAQGEKEPAKDEKKKGGLGGLLGKMKNPTGAGSGEGEGGQPGGILSKMTMETLSIDAKPIDPSVFAVPQGFKLVEGAK